MNRIFLNRKGISILLVVLILASILTISLAVSDLVVSGLRMSKIQSQSTKAFFAAESGVEEALWEARKNTEFDLPLNNQDNIFSKTLENGSKYIVDYASSSPIVIFTSKGEFEDTKRSVAVSFVSSSVDSTACTLPANPDCPLVLKGDVDCDGDVDLCDVSLVSALMGTVSSDPEFVPNADMDEDDKIWWTDVSLIMQKVQGS